MMCKVFGKKPYFPFWLPFVIRIEGLCPWAPMGPMGPMDPLFQLQKAKKMENMAFTQNLTKHKFLHIRPHFFKETPKLDNHYGS